MGYSFTDLGAEGCRRSLNALFIILKNSENNGTEEIGLVTPTPDWYLLPWKNCSMLSSKHAGSMTTFSDLHYCDVIMGVMVSQITNLMIVSSTVHSGADQRKHQSPTSLAFVRGIHRSLVNSPHKWSVTQKMFPFDYIIMVNRGGFLVG